MSKRSEAKNKKRLKERFGKLAESMSEYYHHLDLRIFDELDDEAFAYIMTSVKGVNMLDLNGTDITNESIKLLTKLEYVNELRAKECCHLDNGCISDLNKLTHLVFLHLKSTQITIDGLLQLKDLHGLKELMFSADDAEAIKEKMLQLRINLPGCAFTVNSKPWYFDDDTWIAKYSG